jgi:D-3-phosphoglycerate dehydrogenase / 2-oxoglutarate reductase
MERPLLVCAADLAHVPETREILEGAFRVQYVEPTESALREHLPQAVAYYAALQVQLTRPLLESAPLLKAVTTPSTGLDHLDLAAMQERGVALLCLKDDRSLLDRITATAELAWALILACARRLPAAVEAARQGCWARDLFRGHQIAYKTLGILGCGRLGTIVAQYAQAFRLNVIACDVLPLRVPGVEFVSFNELLERADILSIHVHLTPENRGLIGREAFARMKPGAMLINTSRGAIVDEAAMLEALLSGRLGAAGLDVIEGEWRTDLAEHPLIAYARTHENMIITPHVGGVTYESQAMAYSAAAQKLVDYFD